MPFPEISIKHLFPTPLVVGVLAPDVSADINKQLAAIVLKKAEESKGVYVSNYGGWQSDDRLLEWGGSPVETVLAHLRDLLADITMIREGNEFRRAKIDWRIIGWANINRKGNSNVPHVHPGAYWSAVYYVQVEESDPKNPKGGELELLDPRGALPIFYCPTLRFGIKDYTSAGMSELHAPKAGQCVVFPSWLTHAVRPYIGDGTRISLAFNFAV
jgi:uncharacterized protein (TIGR02466 family)